VPASTGRVSNSAPALTREAKLKGGASMRSMPGARSVMTVPATQAAPTASAASRTMNETRNASTASASPPPGPPLARYAATMTTPEKNQPQNDSAAALGYAIPRAPS
jgi:hypothetical protein